MSKFPNKKLNKNLCSDKSYHSLENNGSKSVSHDRGNYKGLDSLKKTNRRVNEKESSKHRSDPKRSISKVLKELESIPIIKKEMIETDSPEIHIKCEILPKSETQISEENEEEIIQVKIEIDQFPKDFLGKKRKRTPSQKNEIEGQENSQIKAEESIIKLERQNDDSILSEYDYIPAAVKAVKIIESKMKLLVSYHARTCGTYPDDSYRDYEEIRKANPHLLIDFYEKRLLNNKLKLSKIA